MVDNDPYSAVGKQSAENFRIKLDGNFNDQQRIAVDRLNEMFRTYIKPWFPVNIIVRWKFLEPDQLGYCEALRKTTYPLPGGIVCDLVLSKILLTRIMPEHNQGEPDVEIYLNSNPSIKWHNDSSTQTPEGKYDFATAVLHEVDHGIFHGGCTEFQVGKNRDGKRCALWTCGAEDDDFPELVSRWLQFVCFETTNGSFVALESIRHNPEKLYKVLRDGKLFFRRTLDDNNEQHEENLVELAVDSQKHAGGMRTFHIIHFHPDFLDSPEDNVFCATLPSGFQQRELTETLQRVLKTMINLDERGLDVVEDNESFEPKHRYSGKRKR